MSESRLIPGKPEQPDFAAIQAAWTEASAKASTAIAASLANFSHLKPAKQPDLLPAMTVFMEMAQSLYANPAKLFNIQSALWSDWSKLWSAALFPTANAQPVIEPDRGDRRFKDQEWNSNPYFRNLRDSYLLASKYLRALVSSNPMEDASKQAYANVLVEQFLNAVAPTNFALSNPSVARRTVETRGANLVSGFANLMTDLQDGKGIVRRRAPDSFKLGENLAATQGSVVYQNDLMQLIQYEATTPKVRQRPLVYVPPLVNKYYMIDLQPKSSLIRWLVEQGETVFVVSWVDPDENHRNCAVEDYVERGILEAMEIAAKITGEKTVDLFGFCMGGTLIALAQAVLTARKQQSKLGSATLIGSMVDFTDMKDWAAFVNETRVAALDEQLEAKGYIDKTELQQLFSMMRSNDLVWSSFVNHYLLDVEAAPSDLLYWFEDGSHIPQAFMRTYNKTLLVDNHLRVPGAVTLLGEKLDLSKSTTPMFIIGLKDDHVSAWTAVYEGAKYFGGPVRFVLGGSGHNAGVINPPAANKHGYWLNDDITAAPQDWLAKAEKQEGSWWPLWARWLQEQPDNGLVAARKIGSDNYPALEPAPGSYILKAR